MRAIHWPATSSMTTNWGSLRPDSRATMVAAGMPSRRGRTIPASSSRTRICGAGWMPQATPAQMSTAATEPQVPGPGLPRPAPKKVATVQAQRVLPAAGRELGASVVMGISVAATAQASQVFEDFGVQDRRADLVDAHGPLAKVDLAAAVRAEREVLVFDSYEHTAGGAAEEFYEFFLWGHGCVPGS